MSRRIWPGRGSLVSVKLRAYIAEANLWDQLRSSDGGSAVSVSAKEKAVGIPHCQVFKKRHYVNT
jgi:hypothetical protein